MGLYQLMKKGGGGMIVVAAILFFTGLLLVNVAYIMATINLLSDWRWMETAEIIAIISATLGFFGAEIAVAWLVLNFRQF